MERKRLEPETTPDQPPCPRHVYARHYPLQRSASGIELIKDPDYENGYALWDGDDLTWARRGMSKRRARRWCLRKSDTISTRGLKRFGLSYEAIEHYRQTRAS